MPFEEDEIFDEVECFVLEIRKGYHWIPVRSTRFKIPLVLDMKKATVLGFGCSNGKECSCAIRLNPIREIYVVRSGLGYCDVRVFREDIFLFVSEKTAIG